MLANIEGNGIFGLVIIVVTVVAQLISAAKKHTAAAPAQQQPPPTDAPEGMPSPTFEEFLRELTGQKNVPVPPPPHLRPPLRRKPERLPRLSLKVVAPPAPPPAPAVSASPEPAVVDLPVKATGNDAIHDHKKNMMTSTFRRVFRHKRTARQAVLLSEILGQPYSLRQPRKINY